ncbi:MAG: twin-arginine translocation signal domain-containing protein [Planctomycetaceae bacterium]
MTFNRRHFLGTSIAAAGVALSGGSAFAARHSKADLKLGLVTYNWGKDWDLKTIIGNCQASGFMGVELRSTHRHGGNLNRR